MIILGLTGSIGMGKSTVAEMLIDLGIAVHESDRTVHKALFVGGSAVSAIKELLPPSSYPQVYDSKYGDIIRPELGKVVFADDNLCKKMEEILHPIVRKEQQEFCKHSAFDGEEMVVLDIPLLFETGAQSRVNHTIVVSAPEDVQRERVLERPHMSEEKLQMILARQMPDAQKRELADFVLETGGSYAQSREALKEILADIRS